MTRRIALVLKGYPRLSETFIAQEIHGLEQAGLDLLIVSLRHPTDRLRQPLHDAIRAEVLYLPEYLRKEPWRVLRGLAAALRAGRLKRVGWLFLRDLGRDLSRNRVRRFGQALVLARELPDDITCLYAHFLHTPTSVTRYAARLRELPFAVSAHARDIWTIPAWEIQEKLTEAAWLTTCTTQGFRYLQELAPAAALHRLPHGIDLERLTAPPARAPGPADAPVELVTIARAVEKKGLDIMLEALALLPAGTRWHWRHVGAGPLLSELKARAVRLGIADRIEWVGSLAFDDVLRTLRRADIFCFAARIAADGDRDGIPNVVAEAMSQNLPVISARAGAVDELVEDGRTGLLVPPDDPAALAAALAALIADPARRAVMGRAGRTVIENRFAAGPGILQIGRQLAVLAGDERED